MNRLRRYWVVLHRWTALSFGSLLLLAALSGTLLVLARPLDRALHTELFSAPHAPRAALQPLVERLRAEFGPDATLNLRLPLPGETLQVAVSGAWKGTVYVDPASGSERGRRTAGDGFFDVLFEFHSTLYAGDWGRAVMACAALAYLALLVSGVVLWLPLRHRWWVPLRAGGLPFLVNLHRVTGVAFSMLIVVSVATGAYLGWRPLAQWVTSLAGPRTVAISSAPMASPAPREQSTIDAVISRAESRWPGASASVVQIAPGAAAASRVRLRLPSDPHPIGMSMVSVDPPTGRVRATRRWDEQEAGTRAFSIVYPLHTGDLFGVVTAAVVFITGAATLLLAGTGWWIWLKRRIRGTVRRL